MNNFFSCSTSANVIILLKDIGILCDKDILRNLLFGKVRLLSSLEVHEEEPNSGSYLTNVWQEK